MIIGKATPSRGTAASTQPSARQPVTPTPAANGGPSSPSTPSRAARKKHAAASSNSNAPASSGPSTRPAWPLAGHIAGTVESSTRVERGGPLSAFGLLALGAVGFIVYRFVMNPSNYIGPLSIAVIVIVIVVWAFPSTREPFMKLGSAMIDGLFGAATGAASMASGMDHDDIEERRFRVTDQHGKSHDCLLVGELVGGAIKRGDDVLIWGRRDRRKIVRVKRLEIIASGASLGGRTPTSVWMRRVNRYLLVLIILAAVLFLVLLLVSR
jgi:hypothetical protein